MSEQDNDRLGQFFRKAASRPDLSFNEEDWKKLEARLDARDTALGSVKKTGSKLISAAAILFLLFTAGVVINDYHSDVPAAEFAAENNADRQENNGLVQGTVAPEDAAGQRHTSRAAQSNSASGASTILPRSDGRRDNHARRLSGSQFRGPKLSRPLNEARAGDGVTVNEIGLRSSAMRDAEPIAGIFEIGEEQIRRDFRGGSPILELRNKQKAIVELPGAEEAKTGEAESAVREEEVSDQDDHVTTPRLSLLLSFATDFSGTSLSQYSTPGKAFGAMLYYHIGNRWSVSAGVIKNNKQYTGDGEDYQPPDGYWKNYTNGVIPSSIYGACDVLEFPLMVQYTFLRKGKTKLVAGAGTSSYVMQKESYQYRFDEPNPGARERWDSRRSSRFLLNMVNLTVGYERQIFSGFAIGIEPYVKIPIEKIGWCNLKLYSTGAAVTLRYTILRKQAPMPNPSRGPG